VIYSQVFNTLSSVRFINKMIYTWTRKRIIGKILVDGLVVLFS